MEVRGEDGGAEAGVKLRRKCDVTGRLLTTDTPSTNLYYIDKKEMSGMHRITVVFDKGFSKTAKRESLAEAVLDIIREVEDRADKSVHVTSVQVTHDSQAMGDA